MRNIKRIAIAFAALAALVGGVAGCSSDADVASYNTSKEADDFKVFRQIVVENLITGKYELEIEGWCSLGNNDSGGEVSYTCKVGENRYTKDIIKTGQQTMVFAHQLHPINVSPNFYESNFKPSSVVPNVKVRE